MIDLQKEEIITLTAATKRIATRPSLSALYRWRTRGRHGVVLETALLGGRRVTSSQALDRFFAGVTAAADGIASGAVTNLQREKNVENAEQLAEAMGI